MDNILVPLLIGLVIVEIAIYLIHRHRQRRFRAKDLAEVPAMDVWYLPAGWTSQSSPQVPPPPPPGSDPHFTSNNPTSVARPPPTRHIAHHLRTRGYVALGIVEKWKGVPHPDDDTLPRYSPISSYSSYDMPNSVIPNNPSIHPSSMAIMDDPISISAVPDASSSTTTTHSSPLLHVQELHPTLSSSSHPIPPSNNNTNTNNHNVAPTPPRATLSRTQSLTEIPSLLSGPTSTTTS